MNSLRNQWFLWQRSEDLRGGNDIGFLKVIQIMRVLGLYDHLDALVPDQEERPLYQLEYKPRKRASKKRRASREWKWGDEK